MYRSQSSVILDKELRPMNENELEMSRKILTDLSHDVKSPMTTILGFTQMILEDQEIQGATREYLQLIEADAQKLNRILKDGIEKIDQLASN